MCEGSVSFWIRLLEIGGAWWGIDGGEGRVGGQGRKEQGLRVGASVSH